MDKRELIKAWEEACKSESFRAWVAELQHSIEISIPYVQRQDLEKQLQDVVYGALLKLFKNEND